MSSSVSRLARSSPPVARVVTAGPVVVVSHGGVSPLILGALLGLAPVEAVARIQQANDEVYLVRVAGGRVLSIWKLVPSTALEQL